MYTGVKMVNYLEQIKAKLVEQLGVDGDKITLDTSIMDDLGADSLDMVELLMCLEDEMGVSIPDDQALTLKTVGDIVNLLNTFESEE